MTGTSEQHLIGRGEDLTTNSALANTSAHGGRGAYRGDAG